MADLLLPTSKLEAVNWALGQVGFTQVSTLEGVIGRDASIVQASLDNEVRSLCRKALWFARRDATLTPNEDGFLTLPSNTLKIAKPSELSLLPWSDLDWKYERPTMRQGKVFSIFRQSYVWSKSLTVTLVEALGFDDLPDEVKQYAMVFAALETNTSIVRSDDVDKRLQPLLQLTWQSVLDAELENSNYRFV